MVQIVCTAVLMRKKEMVEKLAVGAMAELLQLLCFHYVLNLHVLVVERPFLRKDLEVYVPQQMQARVCW